MPTRKIESKNLITITHVPTNRSVSFSPFIKNFSDNFKSDWEESYVMGRMDPIPTFKRTRRTINLSFSVPSDNHIDAFSNYESGKELVSFLYPIYKEVKSQNKQNQNNVSGSIQQIQNQKDSVQKFYNAIKLGTSLEEQLALRDNVAIMSSSPLVKIKLGGLIENSSGGPLYGYIDGVNLTPDQEMGYVVSNDSLTPRMFDISFNFTVVHAEPLGWKTNNTKRGGPF